MIRPLFLIVGIAVSSASWGQEAGPFTLESAKAEAPDALAAPIRAELGEVESKVLGEGGKVFAEIWTRKSIPGSKAPAGPSGAILHPTLTPGELVAAIRFPAGAADFREQPIKAGTYTLRYGLLPENGAHLGVSEYRDYLLLTPASADDAVATIPQADLVKRSVKASGTNHPAILMLAAPVESAPAPILMNDEVKALWGLSTTLTIKVGASESAMPVQLIVAGHAAD